MTKPRVRRARRWLVLAAPVLAAAIASSAVPAAAAQMPEIRTTKANAVPSCVTPDRLMAFLKSRNGRLEARYKDIAKHYKTYGEAWRVRWDYAFFQMAIETNFLSYRQPNGRLGDVDPNQNNFAGIGTTGGGVPGDSFPDVKTGVHAQIQHLVVYSGERLAAPIAPRTQLKQDEILTASVALDRPVRFNDLARRWAVDRNYDKSIEWVASLYRTRHCSGRQEAEAPAEAQPESRAAARTLVATEVTPPRPVAAARPGTRLGSPQGTRTAHPAVRTVWVRSALGKPRPAMEAAPAPAPRLKPVAAQSAAPLQPTGALVPDAGRAMPAVAAMASPAPITAKVQLAVETGTAPPAAADLTSETPPSEAPAPARPAFDPAKTPPAGLGAAGLACSIGTASYGGSKSMLIKSPDGDKVRYTVLSVLDGFEKSMTTSFLKARAPGGEAIGEFANRVAALDMARTLCPSVDAALSDTSGGIR